MFKKEEFQWGVKLDNVCDITYQSKIIGTMDMKAYGKLEIFGCFKMNTPIGNYWFKVAKIANRLNLYLKLAEFYKDYNKKNLTAICTRNTKSGDAYINGVKCLDIYRVGSFEIIVKDKEGEYIKIELHRGSKTIKGFAKYHIERVLEISNNIKTKLRIDQY